MRSLALACLTWAVSLFLPAAVEAQQRARLLIEKVYVGFMTNPSVTEFKAGAWTPVYVDLRAGNEGTGRGELIVESADSDDVRNRYTVALAPLEPNESTTVLAYTKPGSGGSEIAVTVQLDGRTVATHQDTYAAMDLGQHLYLTVGSHLPSLRQALVDAANKAKRQANRDKRDEEDKEPESKDTGPVRLTTVDDIRLLPNRWFAFEPVDLMILTTGDSDREKGFLKNLLEEREGRKEALAEWVRRGGRLIVSVGRNQDIVKELEAIKALLPISLTGTLEQPRLRQIETFAGTFAAPFPPVEIAKLEPKPGREMDLEKREGDPQHGPLLIARGAYGLGRVAVVAFDLDQPPFTTWAASAQEGFWHKLRVEMDPASNALYAADSNKPQRRLTGFEQTDPDLASQLEMNLEDFEDVPVISFGWVALFILLYILVVGPLDYFFLKKVVKRLELTWITFPTVVITISVVAYFTAYWLKGNDQKINKVDLIDIDLQTQQVYGSTWFTIFSPRIQNYTIGLEPAEPGWAPAPGGGKQNSSVVVSWLGRPEIGFGGYGRTRRSQGLFRRAYDYAPDAAGLKGVPIQVWSTKSFTATWQTLFGDARPLIEADLHFLNEQSPILSGTITSHLPVPLEDVVLYHGRDRDNSWFPLDRLPKDVPQRVDNIRTQDRKKMGIEEWLVTAPADAARRPNPQIVQRGSPGLSSPTVTVMKQLLFQDASPRGQKRNDPLHHLDQGWRWSGRKNEVILFGRIPRQEGQAEDITTSAACPSRLWLSSLPGSASSRPPLSGTLSQDTYVRIFIPVRNGP